jgi:hypothetical protein
MTSATGPVPGSGTARITKKDYALEAAYTVIKKQALKKGETVDKGKVKEWIDTLPEKEIKALILTSRQNEYQLLYLLAELHAPFIYQTKGTLIIMLALLGCCLVIGGGWIFVRASWNPTAGSERLGNTRDVVIKQLQFNNK